MDIDYETGFERTAKSPEKTTIEARSEGPVKETEASTEVETAEGAAGSQPAQSGVTFTSAVQKALGLPREW